MLGSLSSRTGKALTLARAAMSIAMDFMIAKKRLKSIVLWLESVCDCLVEDCAQCPYLYPLVWVIGGIPDCARSAMSWKSLAL